jgi:hypothetical protein
VFLLTVDHNVLALKQLEIPFEIFLAAFCLFLLSMQVLELIDDLLILQKKFLFLVAFSLDLVSSLIHQRHCVVISFDSFPEVYEELIRQ